MRGVTVTLYAKTQTGVDPCGAPEYSESAVTVENVLVGLRDRQVVDRPVPLVHDGHVAVDLDHRGDEDVGDVLARPGSEPTEAEQLHGDPFQGSSPPSWSAGSGCGASSYTGE